MVLLPSKSKKTKRKNGSVVKLEESVQVMRLTKDCGDKETGIHYPVVIITCVHYLGPPVPFSFPDSRDLLEVLGSLSWQRERGGP